MTAIARMTVLNLRTVAPYRSQGLALLGLVAAVGALMDRKDPALLVPTLVLIVTPQIAAYPFLVADKAGLETLYAVLPLPRRSVLYGHYAWAVASFLATTTVGTALALLLARGEAVPFSGRTLATMLTLSWVVFAVNVALQFPLFIRFGYTRVSFLATTLPLLLVIAVAVRLHAYPAVAPIQVWLPLFGAAGVAAVLASAAAAIAADRRHRPGLHGANVNGARPA